MEHNFFRNKTFNNEEFIIQSEYSVCIGVNTTLNNCTIINKQPAGGISLLNCTMTGGEFITKKQLTNWQEHNVIFDGVKFKGRFVGCDLGGSESRTYIEDLLFGNVVNCDFSEAKIHMSRLFNADINSIIFPKWPHFTVLNSLKQKDNIAKTDIHPNLDIFKGLLLKADPEETAVFFNAEMLAKEDEVDIEEVRKFVEQIEDVVY